MTKMIELRSGSSISPIIPQTLDDVYRLATGIAKSGLAPQGMKTAEAITVAILHGLEIGLPPMMAVQRIAVVNNRPTIWGDAIPALLWSRGFKIDEAVDGDGNQRKATCTITRPDGTVISRSFSVAHAITAGLWRKAGPWTQHPDRMLQMRARGFTARDGAADVLNGLYLREEIEDESRSQARDITPAAASIEPPDPDAELPAAAEAAHDLSDEIVDVDGFLEHYRSEFVSLEGDDRKEFVEANADVVARLPKKAREVIATIVGDGS